MNVIKNKFFIGTIFVVLGIASITMGAIAMFVYAIPLLTGDKAEASHNMTNAFKDLTLFNTGTANIAFALIVGIVGIVLGLTSVIWGTLTMTVHKMSFKSKGVVIATGIVGTLSVGTVVPAAIAVQKGTSDEVKMVSEFNDVNNFFNDSFKEVSGSMAGIIYIGALTGANGVLSKMHMKVDFNPAKALLTGKIRDGLTYTYGITAAKPKGISLTGMKGIYTNPSSKLLKAKDSIKMVDSIYMAFVDGLWTGLATLSSQKVATANRVPNTAGTTKGDEGIVGYGRGADANTIVKSAIDDATKKISSIIKPLTKVTQDMLKHDKSWAGSLTILKDMNDLIFRTLMGEAGEAKVSLSNYDTNFKQTGTGVQTQAKSMLFKLVYANILPEVTKIVNASSILEPAKPAAIQTKTFGMTNGFIKGIKEYFKANNDNEKVAALVTIKKTIGAQATIEMAKGYLAKLAPIYKIFTVEHNSLMHKLTEYKESNGIEAAAEALYLYLARIGEVSSSLNFSSKAKGESGSGRLTAKNKVQYNFDYSFNNAGRINSRALLAASLGTNLNGVANHKFIMDIVNGSKMKAQFNKHIFGTKLTNYDLATNTSDYESLYKEFLNR